MRAVRRISGNMNFGESELTDYQARILISAPSIDCLVMRARLLYAGRLVLRAPPPLVAVLQSRPGGKPLEWVSTLSGDLCKLNSRVPIVRRLPPSPNYCPSVRWSLMTCDAKLFKHGTRTFGRLCIGSEAACPGCGTCFKQRMRAIHHISDTRRPISRERNRQMLAGMFNVVGDEAFSKQLDEVDRKIRTDARKQGHSTALAVGSSIARSGDKVGFSKR